MKVIKEIVMSIKDEIHGAEKYAKLATRWKFEDRALADTFAKMASMELDHVNALHAHAVRLIKAYNASGKETPVAMQAVWDYEHENMIEWIARINVLLNMYNKA